MDDPIDEAIGAAQEQQGQTRMVQRTWTLGNGRPFGVAIPLDCTDGELLEIAGHMSLVGWAQVAQDRQGVKPPVPKLVIARGTLPPSGRN